MPDPRSSTGWRGKNPGKGSKKTTASLQQAVGLLILAIVAIVGVIAGLVFFAVPKPKTKAAGFWVTKYADPRLPIDPTSEADRDAFKAGAYVETPADSFGDSWPKVIAFLKASKEKEPVLLYISAAACLSDAGDVLVLPADANPDTRTGWLPLKDVLAAVKECKSKEKLILLDIHRPLADPAIGILTNDVASRAADEVESVNDPGRLVLLSCAPGQVSLGSELLGRSIFNFYVEEGLRGWADEKPKDKAIHARELAAFVQTRVEDWAKRARNAAQTPTLLGTNEADFKLLALPSSGSQPHLTEDARFKAALDPSAAAKGDEKVASKEPAKDEAKKDGAAAASSSVRPYPKFLTEGWQLAETWRKANAGSNAPRPLNRLEAALVKAEREWRFGRDEAAVRSDLQSKQQAATTQYTRATTLARPAALPSVALVVSLGTPPDSALILETQALFALRAQKTEPGIPVEKLRPDIKTFLDKVKPANEGQLAAAVFDALSNPEPSQKRIYFDMIKYADLVLREYRSLIGKDGEATYVEPLLLQQLIAQAPAPINSAPPAPNAPPSPPPASPWPNDVLLDAVQSIWRGEKLDARADAFPWVESLIDQAATRRHVAQVLLRSPGFVAPTEAEAARKAANALDLRLDEIESAFMEARRVLSLAQNTLPSLQAYLDETGDASLAASWIEAAAAASALASTLHPPTDAEAKSQWTREDYTRTRVDDWRNKTDATNSLIKLLLQKFTSSQVESASLAAGGPAAPPEAWAAIDALLTTPLVPIDQRPKLIEAALILDRALHKKHFDATSFTTAGIAPADARAAELKRVLDRADRSIALLALGGLDTSSTDEPRKVYAGKLDPAGRNALTKALWSLWKILPDKLLAETDLSRQERLARIVPALQVTSAIDNGETSPPTTRLRLEREARLWNWTAGFYRYLRNDVDTTDALNDASQALDSQATKAISQATIKLETDPSLPVPELKPLEPHGTIGLLVTRGDSSAQGEEKPPFRVLAPPDPKLSVTIPEVPALEPGQTTKLRLNVELKGGNGEANASGPVPKGVMVEAIVGGRPYYVRPLVNFGTALEPLKLVLSDDAKSAAAPVSRISLRTIAARQNYYLWVQNPTAKPRNVEVRLHANGDDSPIATGKLRIEPGATSPVSAFVVPMPAPTTPPTPAPAVELKRGLVVKLFDADRLAVNANDEPIDLLRPEIEIGPPTDLIQVVEVKYTPANENNGFRNLLSARIRAKSALTNGECNVSLVLQPELIPGLKGPAVVEQLSGVLKAAGDEVTLSATGIPLDDKGDDSAAFFLAVDGDARALKYRTTFDRQGLVSRTPQLDTRAALRISGKRLAEVGVKYPVTMAVDNPPDDKSTLVVGFLLPSPDGRPTLRFDQTVPARAKRIALTPDPKGILAFEASIADQNVSLESRGLSGPVKVQASLISGRARIEGQPQLIDVILDGKPEIQSFEIVKANGASSLQVRASGSSQSGIDTVKFFTGLPLDDKLPSEKDAIRGQPSPDGSFAALLPIPKDAKDRLDVSVEFKNHLGKHQFARLVYDVPHVAGAMVAGGPGDDSAPKTGNVTGKVTFAGIEQPDLDVVVFNEKSEAVATKKTDAKGTYLIEGIKPGNLWIYVKRDVNNSQALEKLVIKVGETVKVDLGMNVK